MEPRIQYARTADGVNVAYATYGQGPPLVWSQPPSASHVQLEWEQPIYRAAFSRLARWAMLVRFDTRGVGLSDRDVDDISLDARMRDLEAVLDRLNTKSFTLLGFEEGGSVAIAYAARHPEEISRLILVNCSARRGGRMDTAGGKALKRLVDEDDWEMLTANLAAMAFGYGGEETKRYAQFLRSCTSPSMLRRLTEVDHNIDVSDLLRRIQAPTLVVRHRGIKWLSMDATRELAAGIPNAQILLIEGLYADHGERLFAGISDFLGERDLARTYAKTPAAATAVILFADIVDSTALTERLGDAAFRNKARDLDAGLRTIIRDHEGTPIEGKLLGDGVLATFASASKAIEAALACGEAGEEGELPLHLGLHAGDVIREEGNVFGGAVNIASRVSAESKPGEVLVSDIVRGLARTSAGVAFEELDERELRGVSEPVKVFRVRRLDEAQSRRTRHTNAR